MTTCHGQRSPRNNQLHIGNSVRACATPDWPWLCSLPPVSFCTAPRVLCTSRHSTTSRHQHCCVPPGAARHTKYATCVASLTNLVDISTGVCLSTQRRGGGRKAEYSPTSPASKPWHFTTKIIGRQNEVVRRSRRYRTDQRNPPPTCDTHYSG